MVTGLLFFALLRIISTTEIRFARISVSNIKLTAYFPYLYYITQRVDLQAKIVYRILNFEETENSI